MSRLVCNATGTINPIKEVTALAQAVGAIVVVDAAQALAHMKVDVQDWNADFVATNRSQGLRPHWASVAPLRQETSSGSHAAVSERRRDDPQRHV